MGYVGYRTPFAQYFFTVRYGIHALNRVTWTPLQISLHFIYVPTAADERRCLRKRAVIAKKKKIYSCVRQTYSSNTGGDKNTAVLLINRPSVSMLIYSNRSMVMIECGAPKTAFQQLITKLPKHNRPLYVAILGKASTR